MLFRLTVTQKTAIKDGVEDSEEVRSRPNARRRLSSDDLLATRSAFVWVYHD